MKATRAITIFEEGKRNFRLLFGVPLKVDTIELQHGTTKQHAYFKPGAVFALDLWDRNDYGTKEWRVYVLRAVWPGEVASRVPQVEPGAEVLLFGKGKNKVQKIMRWFKDVEKAGEILSELHPDRFRAAHARFTVNMDPRRNDGLSRKILKLIKELGT